uniref:Uncharacterized protein n=1 Tax=Cacopsylla melanoneura TaxID=428564 RepID=A0A8D8T5I9_9HEMI
MNFCFLSLLLASSICTLNAAGKADDNDDDYFSPEDWDSRETTPAPTETCIVLYRMKEKPNETMEDVLQNVAYVGRKLRIRKPLQDVVSAYRSVIPKILFPKPIIVRMVNFTRLDAWASSYRARNMYKEPWDLMVGVPSDPWCLKREVEDWANERKYKKVWFRNKDVLYHKKDYSKIYQVHDFDHLHYLHNKSIEHLVEVTAKPVEEIKTKNEHLVEVTAKPVEEILAKTKNEGGVNP